MEEPPSMLPALTAVPLPSHELRDSPPHLQSLAEKEEVPSVTSPASSSEGSNNPGLFGSQTQPAWSGGGSSTRNQDLQLPKRRPTAGKRYQCSGDGCRLACRSIKELLNHMQVHYRPTESLEGKTFRCSTSGCLESFPNMQDLMGHMKVHYKPNRYFKCENCMSRFRTHRSLFKHLHSCSDANTNTTASPALTSEKPIFPSSSGLEKEPPGKLLEELPKLQSFMQHFKKEALLPGTTDTPLATDSLPAGLPGPLETGPLPASPTYPLLEQSLFGPPSLTKFSGPPHPSVSGSFLPYMHPTSYALPQAAVQNRLRPFLPAGQGLPVSNAVWKKSQESGAYIPAESSHSITSDSGQLMDRNYSDDEGLNDADQGSVPGLFQPAIFRSLLFKAKKATGRGLAPEPQEPADLSEDPNDPLFSKKTVTADVIPAPKMFTTVIQRQWSSLGSAPSPSSLDKKLFNVGGDLSKALEVPDVDAPVAALQANTDIPGEPEDSLKAEDKKAEQTLQRTHLSAAWAVKASTAASFFNRASLIWLRELQERIPLDDVRSHLHVKKLLAAVEFSADATLSAARFASRAIGGTVTSRRLLWLKQWQADMRHKWRLATAPFKGDKLFGEALDKVLVDSKDKGKVLPSRSRKSEFRSTPYVRRSYYRTPEAGGGFPRPQRPFAPRQEQNQDRADRNHPFNNKRPFGEAGGHPFRHPR
uniref:C2H2-type domain-containing protein n=1 Tax=Naja naja TaxID=35670 RepID=A0A8C6XA67_NAJNA